MIEKVQETHLYLWLSAKKSRFIGQLDEIIKYANDVLPLINYVFSNYTIHGIKHSINVMEYMYALITDIEKLSELEVALLINSALLHDIGMVTMTIESKIESACHQAFGTIYQEEKACWNFDMTHSC